MPLQAEHFYPTLSTVPPFSGKGRFPIRLNGLKCNDYGGAGRASEAQGGSADVLLGLRFFRAARQKPGGIYAVRPIGEKVAGAPGCGFAMDNREAAVPHPHSRAFQTLLLGKSSYAERHK